MTEEEKFRASIMAQIVAAVVVKRGSHTMSSEFIVEDARDWADAIIRWAKDD